MEQPVWARFRDAVAGHQGWRRAAADVAAVGGPWRTGEDPGAWRDGAHSLLTMTGPALRSLEALAGAGIRFDLVFADPPYGGTIQYGELSSLWNAFLLDGPEALAHRRLQEQAELGCNRALGHDLGRFADGLQAHFAALGPVMAPGAPLIVTFHSPRGALRHAAIGAIVRAGFRLREIRHNAGARLSAKACRQPFGSVAGDFWLVFDKQRSEPVGHPGDWSERIVARARTVLAAAETALPFTELINRLEPLLAADGFFAAREAPVALDSVLKHAAKGPLRLVEGEVAGVRGWLWTVSGIDR